MREKVLEIKGLNKAFGKKQIIHNLNLTVYAGEILGFLGPNGSGKTTTIKMVMGFLTPDQGEISICGMSVKKNYEEAMGLVGGIVENPEMYIEFTGRKNLEMYARIHDHVSPEQIEAAVKLVKAENYIDEKVKKYSLGMKQRLGIAQAVVHKPRLLVLDEPTNGLDAEGIKELRDILKKLAHEENVAILVSSHLMSEMELMCDRVALIDRGMLLEEKEIHEFVSAGAKKYVLLIENPEQTVSLLTNLHVLIENVSPCPGDNTKFQAVIHLEQGDAWGLIRRFVQENVALYGVREIENSLEDAYISAVKGVGGNA